MYKKLVIFPVCLLQVLLNIFILKPVTAGQFLKQTEFFSDAETKTLLDGELITKGFLKNTSLVHTANTDDLLNIPVSQYINKDLSSYEMLCTEKAFLKYELSEDSKLSLFNSLTAFSKLTGMKYFSRLDKNVKTLIADCHRIESAADMKRADDIVYKTISPKTVNYFKITDNRLGDLVFRSELYNEGNNFILKNVCVQPIKKFFISVCNSEEYQLITFFIYDADAKGYFYYSINAMRIRSGYFLKLGKLSAGSFANRIRGNTAQIIKLLGLDWGDRLKAFE
jgi:hypothetical protein